MNRRQFCARLAALSGPLAIAPLLQACTEISPVYFKPETTSRSTTETGTTVTTYTESRPTVSKGVATIALVKTTDRSAGVRRALEILEINPISGRNVLVKPNFNSADAAPGSTHDEVLRTLLASLDDMGARSLTLGDRSGMGNTRRVMQAKGVSDLAQTFGLETIAFDELLDGDWTMLDGEHWSRGYPIPNLLLDAECVVQTCNLKTHRFGGHFTLSLKNSVGFVGKTVGSYNYMNELHGTDAQRKMIAEINAAYAPSLIVMDGVEAFVDGGPDAGTKAATEVILAGTDRIAMDAVGVAILRLFGTTAAVSRGRVFEQEQIARAVELGLGVDAPEKIHITTGDDASATYAEEIREILLA